MIKEFWLPDYVPPSLNELLNCHYHKRTEYKEEALEYVSLFVRGLKGVTLYHISYLFFFPDKRRRDNDNYCAKYLTDALRYHGVLLDDDSKSTGPSTYYVEWNNPAKIKGTKITMEVVE